MNQALPNAPSGATDQPAKPPLLAFLEQAHARYRDDFSGAVANYIPELNKADPARFGVAIATIDGHVYEVGDSAYPFTIQSVSKAFVFGLALELLGADHVESFVGVEPSGEAFNSIRLNANNQPFNPMVNAGAIACSGLIYAARRDEAFELIRSILGRCAGRDLDVDESVYQSETATGDRNRAIGWMLRNYGIVKDNVDAVLDVYFRQCAILVSARDLAVMAATLANGGVNPLTGDPVLSPLAVARVLSVMTSSGMYDYAGEWVYRVGMPAKSGVGGGIIAALPSQIGLGTYSPLLDEHGNSARGLRLCEALSAHFDLHVLNRANDVRTCIVADYDVGRLQRRGRQPHEQKLLEEQASTIRIMELTGTLAFSNVDYIARRLLAHDTGLFTVLDLRRVPLITTAAAKMLADLFDSLSSSGTRPVLAGIERDSRHFRQLQAFLTDSGAIRTFSLLDEAIEWAEDQVIFRYGGFSQITDVPLAEQELLKGLAPEDIADLEVLCETRSYHPGERIIACGDEADSVFFLQRGMVSVKLAEGVRLATLVPGTAFGELALIGGPRSADVFADNAVLCRRVPLDTFDDFRMRRPFAAEIIVRNLAQLLAHRLLQANTKIDLLSAN
ncbi:glutaminase A [Pseudorhodoplanes sp.]|uniref:glutaminase A n=1 Tax=Pseudorhodoplanes sp. TaxID=1934341 RepID=UPI002C2BEDBD|nr:glutaminase A [Pseudorhodoplanes sp.]HWV53581.1 glutaminase A [Pseudorhodoplanes sp.]